MSTRFIKPTVFLRRHYHKNYTIKTRNIYVNKTDHQKFICHTCGEKCPFQIYWCDKKCNTVKKH